MKQKILAKRRMTKNLHGNFMDLTEVYKKQAVDEKKNKYLNVIKQSI